MRTIPSKERRTIAFQRTIRGKVTAKDQQLVALSYNVQLGGTQHLDVKAAFSNLECHRMDDQFGVVVVFPYIKLPSTVSGEQQDVVVLQLKLPTAAA